MSWIRSRGYVRAIVGYFSVLLPLSCIGGAVDRPLYPPAEGVLPKERVARLVGYVQTVDGKDVRGSDGGYLLLPGCHLIQTPSDWGNVSPQSAVTAHTGQIPYAIPMQAGRQYRIDVSTRSISGPVGPVAVRAYEFDASGHELATFRPIQSSWDIDECRQKALSLAP